MHQTKIESFVEALVNTVIGFSITMAMYPLINWICGIEMSFEQTSLSTILFTILSVLRSYLLRRFFNNIHPVKLRLTQIMTSFLPNKR